MKRANTAKRRKSPKAKKAKTWTLKSKLIPAIRKIWFYSPLRREVLTNAKVGDKFRCNQCDELFEKVQIDHINPIVSLQEGFEDWNSYIGSTFCDIANLQALCEQCHQTKSMIEREKRKIYRKKRKKNVK